MKKVVSFVLCLTLILAMAVPVMATNLKNLYPLAGEDNQKSLKPLATIASSDLVETKDTFTYYESLSQELQKLPIYISTTPVTIKLLVGYDGTYDDTTSQDAPLPVFEFGVDSVSLGVNYYKVKEANPVVADGKVTYWTEEDGTGLISKGKTVTIKEFVANRASTFLDEVGICCIHKAATITISDTGCYMFKTYGDGVCEAIIKIQDSSAPTIPTTSDSNQPFTDVAAESYCSDAVKWAVEKNITAGTTATTFSPNSTCTNAQILTFLWRANGSPEPTEGYVFNDVLTSDYYYDAARWAGEKHLVSGIVIGASTPCTRSQAVIYLWKLAGSPSQSTSNTFTDVSPNAAYADAVTWAVKEGITSGNTATTFAPDKTCTRGQIATFLYRAYH